MYTSNIIGHGFVGGSLGHLFEQKQISYNVYDIRDLNNDSRFTYHNSIEKLVAKSENHSEPTTLRQFIHLLKRNTHVNYYFICVPTPSMESGECDTSLVKSTILELNKHITKPSYIIIKSTIPPNYTNKFQELISDNHDINLVFSPEFLREKTCNTDMYNTDFTLIGHEGLDKSNRNDLKNLFETVLYSHNKDHKVYFYKSILCELFKYTINVYLAVKVWYANELYDICDKFHVDYKELQDLFPFEPRLGSSHLGVPGHDGFFGFGGSCLPKETRALSFLQSQLGLPNAVLTEILKRNDTFRIR